MTSWLVVYQGKRGAATKKGAKSADSNINNDDNSEASSLSWDTESQKENVLTTMIHLLELDLCRVWKLPQPEESFLNLFLNTAYLMLENQNNTKNKVIKRCLFILLATIIKKYNQNVGINTAIIHMLHHHEHLAVVIVELMEMLHKEYECSHVVGDIVREIGKMNPREFARDSSGVKNISAFIANLSEKLPVLVLPTLSVLLPHLDGEVRM